MAYGKQVTYVDVNAAGKAIPLDLLAICERCKVKGMAKRLEQYKANRAALAAELDGILQDVEQAMANAGTLDDNMALQAWFNYGQNNVVRIYGARHGQPKVKTVANNSTASVAQLFGGIAKPARSNGIRR